jgi:hydrogenase expression/formation protein HypD
VRIVYSAIDAISIARNEPDRQVVFFGIGFETTAPGTALVILEAKQQGLENFSVLSAHKALPPALRALAASPALNVQGFLCPGHVTAIIGREAYRFLADDFRVPCVVTGFEPLDVMQGVALLVRQVTRGEALVEIQYARAVRPEGNPRARKVMDAVFQPADSAWRGLGEVSGSGMAIAPTYAAFDAARKFPIDVPESPEPAGCRCGEVLCGALRPDECGLFGDGCTPAHPIGPCMVSSEGACAAWYRYGRAGEGDDE